MVVLWWVLQIILFLVVWKILHLLMWNARKMLGGDSLLLSVWITVILTILAVLVVHTVVGAWWQVLAWGALLGLANGEYEYNRSRPSDRKVL